MDNNKYTVIVHLGAAREAIGNRKAFSPEKVHSRVFEASKNVENPILRSAYLNRPMSNVHRHAKITVEFITDEQLAALNAAETNVLNNL